MRHSTVGIILVLALGCLVVPHAAEAQQPTKVHRIGALWPTSAANTVFGIEVLWQGLRELGYVEGQNLTLEHRWDEGRHERLADLAAELVRLPVDLIVTYSTLGVLAAQHATTTLPIVGMGMEDPVEQGIVASQARPGGNLTGLFIPSQELEAKRLELLKEAVPGVTRVAVLLEPANPLTQASLKALELTARELGVALHPVAVHGPDDIDRALSAIVHEQAEALVVTDQPLFAMHGERIWEFAVEKRLPMIGFWRPYLIAYGINYAALQRRAAVFVDKILHGARPGDLPLERGVDFELTIDLKIAQELGLTIPESLLLRADKVFPVLGAALPASLRIVPPDHRVASELAAFSGKWVGTWEGYVTNEQILVVEAIDPPHALVIRAWGNGTLGAGTAHPLRIPSNWERRRGQFVEGTLQVSGGGGATVIYRLQPDGTLAATWTHLGVGGTAHAILTRAQE